MYYYNKINNYYIIITFTTYINIASLIQTSNLNIIMNII